ncbi:MAG: prolipoprotein diacylglyceryl transferase [Verrucomicrobia bacterium]|nr:prolipoprotein diacylglyceryl transferase [Verrucomicrobiota bacterium]
MYRVAIDLGGFIIYWYGVMLALGVLAGIWTASRRAPLTGIASNTVVDLGPWLVVGILVGARIMFAITFWDEFFVDAPWYEIFMVRHGGLVFNGGLVGASLACIIFARVKHVPLWKLADILAPSISLGHAFGRIGCFLNGCCYGRATDSAFAVHFPDSHATAGIGVHPVQLYSVILNFALYFSLAFVYRRKKFDGQVFGLYLVIYACLRFFVEFFRGDYHPDEYIGIFTPAQAFSFILLPAGIILIAVQLRRGKAKARDY